MLELLCASLKSNSGHLEAAAAAAGLASLAVGPLSTGIVVVNAQLRGLAAAVCGEEALTIATSSCAYSQVERPLVVHRVVARIFVPHARGTDGSSDSRHLAKHVAAELVWLQRDHRPRGIRRKYPCEESFTPFHSISGWQYSHFLLS